MATISSDNRSAAQPASLFTSAPPRPPSLTPSSIPTPLSSNTDTTNTSTAPNSSVLTPSGVVSDGFAPSGAHASSPHTSQAGGPLYYPGHMTGSWPTPGLSQPPAYTYGNSGSGPAGSGPLAQPPYNRTPASYGSAPSPSHQHFPGRASTSAPNGESLPAPHSYQDQPSFPSPVSVGGAGTSGGGSLGSPLNAPGGHQSGLAQPMIGNPTQNTARQAPPGQNNHGGGPVTTQDGGSYRSAATYYPQTTAPQQPSFSAYASPVTQPSPTTAPPATSSGSIPRGAGSIPAMAPPLQYPGGRGHPVQSMVSYTSYSPTSGPVMSNMHHPGSPLAMVGGMSNISSYSHHSGLSPHHPHPLYVHHPGGPAPQSERPFKCNECPQAFNRNHDLKRHQRIHLAVKPFGCEDCEKRFSRKDALKRHKLVKGCGSTSPPGAAGAATGGNEGPPDDRSAAAGGDRDQSPKSIKKEL
ncbi:uncharacterized protein B0H64DRAFT_370825 [Chaetomium fimeti]|uniref:C2H2-type domain-containing protein n=1 Tax=Chaetomium fimeti TaxID=1854472 RepID=A0AAE0HLC0_9PEZI|nr:hypothetical protein B0H64DRAFT_370825 [Chaetomium fimeti]